MWNVVRRTFCAGIILGLSACAGGGNTLAPLPRTGAVHEAAGVKAPSAPHFDASALPSGFIPMAIMRDGQIAGSVGISAAILSHGRVTILPSLAGATNAVALWVNSRGHAVGYTAFIPSVHPLVATLFAGGTARNLNPNAPLHQAEAADVIGEQDQIYGTSDPEDFLDSLDLVRFSPSGGFVHLNPVNGQRAAGFIYDIGTSGQFAGYEWPEELPFNLGTEAMTGRDLAISLSRVALFTTTNTAINAAGDVAGYADPSNSTVQTSGTWAAFVRTRRGTIAIPFLPGSTSMQPSGINNRGDVVGVSTGLQPYAAVFFYTHGAVYDVGANSTPRLSNIEGVVHGLSNDGRFVVATDSGYYLVRKTASP